MKSNNRLVLIVIAALMLLGACRNNVIDVETFSLEAEQVTPGIDSVCFSGTYDFFRDAESVKINIGHDSTLYDANSHSVALEGKDFSVTVKGLSSDMLYYYCYSFNFGLKKDVVTETKRFHTLPAPKYTISLSALPGDGGTVIGGGSYEQGSTCTVTAAASAGYNFVNWTEGGIQVSAQASYSFTVNGNRELVANFMVGSFLVSATADPDEGGTVSGAGSFEYGQSCTLRATANAGYNFVNWTEDGNVVSLDANYTFTVNGNRSLVAHFSASSYTVTVSANPTNGGTVSGGGTFTLGQSCTVTAAASTGYNFVNWTENGVQVSTQASYTFTVNNNHNLVANFTAGSFVVSAAADPEEGGTVSGAGGYEYGQSCTLSATANAGYSFVNWTENGSPVSSNASYTFTVSGNRSLVAHFNTQSYTVSVSANPTNGGTVSGSGTYNYGQSCTVMATASTGYNFVNWTENGTQVSTNASYTFTVNGNRNLVANFAMGSYLISAMPDPEEGGTVSGGGSYEYGQNCTLNATAAMGYNFVNWTENGNPVSTNASYSFTVEGNRSLVAHFIAQSYTITVSANPGNGGLVTGGGNYTYGQNCTVSATAASNYVFVNWTENGTQVSTNASYSFAVTGDRNLVANFELQAVLPTVITNQVSNVTQTSATGGGNVTSDGNATIIARGVCWNVNHNPTTDNYYTLDGTGTGGFTSSITGLSPNTTYYVRAYAINNVGTAYGNEVSFTTLPQIPTGAIDGLFSVSPSKQVYFAQGNMQYQASSNTWRFAEHQWDFVGGTDYQSGVFYGNVSGSSNNNVSPTYSGWIDLFGFGTSGWNSGATVYQPYGTSQNNAHYYPGGSYTNDLTGAYVNADWAYHNPISNGGNQAGLWRCLTHEEYIYLIEGRANAIQKYSLGTVNNVSGLIILPDSWTLPSGLTFTPHAANHTVNVYNVNQWAQMESAGAVFLPVTGTRQYNIYFAMNKSGGVFVGLGDYWSSTADSDEACHSMSFMNNNVYPGDTRYRMLGTAVRPVYEAQ